MSHVEPGDFQNSGKDYSSLQTCDSLPVPKLPFGPNETKSVQNASKQLIHPSSASVEEAVLASQRQSRLGLDPAALQQSIDARVAAQNSAFGKTDHEVRALQSLRWQCQTMLQRIRALEGAMSNGSVGLESLPRIDYCLQALDGTGSLEAGGLLQSPKQESECLEDNGNSSERVSRVGRETDRVSIKTPTFSVDNLDIDELVPTTSTPLHGALLPQRSSSLAKQSDTAFSKSHRRSQTQSALIRTPSSARIAKEHSASHHTLIPKAKKMSKMRAEKLMKHSQRNFTAGDQGGSDPNWRKSIAKRKVRAVENVLSVTIDDINATIAQLAMVYEQQDSLFMEMMHGRSAVIIQRLIRGYLIRTRFSKAQQALRSFRLATGTKLVHRGVFFDVNRAKRIAHHISRREFEQGHRMLTSTLDVWHDATLTARPIRKRQQECVEAMRRKKLRDIVSDTFQDWAEIAIGPHSRKAIKASYDLRFMECRERLIDEQLSRPLEEQMTVTKSLIVDEMYKDNIRRIRNMQYKNILNRIYVTWKHAVLSVYFQQKEAAYQHWKNTITPKVFIAWKRFLLMRENEAYVNQAWVKDSFIPVHNMRQVINFHRKAVLTRFFPRWKLFTWKLKQLRIRLRAFQINRLGLYFRAWVTQAEFQHQIRALCINEWKNFGSRIRRVPFRAWYIWMKKRKTERETQEILLNAYRRRKKRIEVAGALRLWKHQVLYGKTGGGSSRVELIRAIETQKQRAAALEDAMEQQEITLSHTNTLLEGERKMTAELQKNLQDKQERLMGVQFAKHHVEQEVVRLQSLMDSISIIHPGTVAKLIAMDPTSQLQDTGVGAAVQNNTFVTSTMKHSTNLSSITNTTDTTNDKKDGSSSARSNTSLNSTRLEGMEIDGDEWDTDQQVVEVETKRKKTTRPLPNIPKLSNTSEDDGLVWVNKDDAQILLRVEYVRKLLRKEYNSSASNDSSDSKAVDVEHHDKEFGKIPSCDKSMNRLRVLLLFVLFGGVDVLNGQLDPLAEEEARELEKRVEEEKETKEKQAQEQLVTKRKKVLAARRKRQQKAISKVMLHDDSNWSEFVQVISRKFPLFHQLHRTPKDGLSRRIVKHKKQLQNKVGKQSNPVRLLVSIDSVQNSEHKK